jgi:acyl carrier protein
MGRAYHRRDPMNAGMDEDPGGRMDDDIRRIVVEHGRVGSDVAALARGEDLYAAGMTSHASVSVMLALEDHFDVEFPEHMLEPSVFASVASISAALRQLQSEGSVRGV